MMPFARLLPSVSGQRFLFVGEKDDIPEALSDIANDRGMALPLDALTHQVIARVRPDTILSPLLGAHHDILDVAHTLLDLKYRGDLVAISRKIPNFAMVQKEVGDIWTVGKFSIVEADQLLH